jgi:tRNA (Thr-GGU) A37 N-methylase
LQCCPTRYHIPPPRGLFATRSPFRVNPIALTVVRLLERKGTVLYVKGVDTIEGSPILDIKPYTRRDRKSKISAGWIDEVKIKDLANIRRS